MSWRGGRTRVSVLAEMALRKERIAERLGELREAHSLTQEQAAGRVGVTLRQWQRWEAGDSVPYPRNLDQIASKFGLSVAEFFDEPARFGLRDEVTELQAEVAELKRQMAEMVALATDRAGGEVAAAASSTRRSADAAKAAGKDRPRRGKANPGRASR